MEQVSRLKTKAFPSSNFRGLISSGGSRCPRRRPVPAPDRCGLRGADLSPDTWALVMPRCTEFSQPMSQLGHVWTVPAVQVESDISAKRSGAVMYSAYCRLEDYLCRDAAAMAAGPDVIR
jgi:hypothetical protein